MKKVIASVLMAGMSLASLAGCSNVNVEGSTTQTSAAAEAAVKNPVTIVKEIGDVSSEQEKAFRQGYLNFAFDLLRRNIEQDGSSANVMVSPASVMIALDMTASGAANDTVTQMMALYGGADDPQGQLSYAAKLLGRLNSSQGVTMHAADSIWVNGDIMPDGLAGDYTDFVGGHFDASAESLRFDNAALGRINGWVNDNTDGMIDGILDELDPATAMVLINAIAFDGKWEKQYDDSQVTDESFTAASGDVRTVQMMSGAERIYLENDLATGFAKYYAGNQYAFVVMLPKDVNQNAGDMISSFTGESFDAFMNSASRDYTVVTKLPEFSYDWGRTIVPQLKAMGMEVPFDGSRADFSGMTGSDNGLYIGNVIHKTRIEVGRNGTRAAAATAVEMRKNSIDIMPPEKKEVVCDRPFAYAIVDMTDNTPVFVGTVNDITK